jgi:serine/threonine protein kinase/WD40 repeat protein/tetratricopeptide (TPR) repeat protein
MNDKSEVDSLELLADEFVERLRGGEMPSVEDYANSHPNLASRIREVFPALAAMEGVARALSVNGPAAPDAGSATAQVPEQIGDYRILREVGRGGMGVVYEAEQVSLGRHVALKVLLPQLQSRPRFLERFRREARAAGRLHHTNIVPVFGVGESDGIHFFVMQFIAGVGLDQVIEDVRRLRGVQYRPDPSPATPCQETLSVSVAKGLLDRPSQTEFSVNAEPQSSPAGSSQLIGTASYHHSAARLALQAARALAHAHRPGHGHGIVHRDVKPSNLLLDLEGNLWVTDFGLAKTDEASDITGSHDILGTLRYMSPERFEGQEVDGRADIYSLGLTLYEMLTLRPAFSEYDRIQLMRQIVEGNFRRPREVDPSIPRDLETIVLKAAAREPKDRYRTADELAEDLELFIANRPIKSRRVSNWEHLQRWARRNPVLSSLSGTVALLLVAVTVISLISYVRLEEAYRDQEARKKEIENNVKTLEFARAEQGRLRIEAEDQAWRALIARAHASHTSGRRGQRFEGLESLLTALKMAPERDVLTVRNEAVGCLALPDVEVMREFDWLEGSVNAVFSPDMTKYARCDKVGNITVRRVVDDTELFAIPTRGLIDAYAGMLFSPDGRHLKQHCKQSVWVWRVDGLAPVEVLSVNNSHHADFSADGSNLLSLGPDGRLSVYDLDTSKPSRGRNPDRQLLLPRDTLRFWRSPLDRDLILLQRTKSITIFDWNTGRVKHSLNSPASISINWMAWHPEGKLYAVAGDNRRVWICSAESNTIVATLDVGDHSGLFCWFNPSGDRLWISDWRGRNQIWDWKAGMQLFEFHEPCTLPTSISQDGTMLVAAKPGTKLQLLRVAEGLEACRWPTSRFGRDDRAEFSLTPVISPDGSLLACFCNRGLGIFDVPRRELIALIPSRWALPLGFTPDHQGLWFVSSSDSGIKEGLNLLPISCCGDRIAIGLPRHVLSTPSGYCAPGLSSDGSVLLAPGAKGSLSGVTLSQDVGGPNFKSTFLGEQTDVRYCSVSPDGTWAISCTHGAGNGKPSITLWNTKTHERIEDLESWGGHSGFSADGRWAWTAHGNDNRIVRVWDTKTWQPVSTFPGAWVVFSPDARFLAVGGIDTGIVRLVRVPDGEEVVRLSVPANVQFDSGCFTPDGGKFIAVAAGQWYLQEWDLHAIRRQLQSMGLDWENTPIPPLADGPRRYPPPLTVELPTTSSTAAVIETGPMADPYARWILASFLVASQPLHPAGYHRKAFTLVQLNRFEEALSEIDTAIALAPDDAELHHARGRICRANGDLVEAMAAFDRAVELDPDNLAHSERANTAAKLHRDRELLQSAQKMVYYKQNDWNWRQMLAIAYLVADPPLRDPGAAIKTAKDAVGLAPGNSVNHTVLAYALYQSGRWEEAAKEFAEGHHLRPAAGIDAMSLFGLAMCSRKLGDDAKARSWFAMAVVNKDTGRPTGATSTRLFDAIYEDATKEFSLPPPPRK